MQGKYKIPRGGKMKFTVVKKGLYYDSVKLMLVTNKLLELDSITNVAVVMGTDLNKDTLIRNNLYSEEAEKATKNDLIIAMDTDSKESFESALIVIDSELNSRTSDNSDDEIYLSLNSATITNLIFVLFQFQENTLQRKLRML